MATSPRISNVAAIAACNAIVDLLDAGAGDGYIQIRTGAPPATVETAASGTLLSTHNYSDPAFGGAADANPGAIATASAIDDDTSADATGTAGWFRSFDSDNNPIIQGTVGTSSADMIINATAIAQGGLVQVNSHTVTLPEA